MKLRIILLIFCLTLCLTTNGTASGHCIPDDGNNSRKDAKSLQYTESTRGVVCPDDPYDFYVLKVAESDNVSGSISFLSYQASTTLLIEHDESGRKLVDNKATTDEELQFVVEIPEGKLPPGIYYARVSFEPGADYDHVYTLRINLSSKTRIQPDGKFVVDKPAEFKPTHMSAVLPSQPWPMYRGDARRTGRSTYPGPGALAKFSWFCDIFNLFGPIGTMHKKSWMVFQNLLISSTNYFYSTVYYNDIEATGFTSEYKGYVYHGYHTIMGNLSFPGSNKLPGNLSMETCLDQYGNLLRTYPLALRKYEFNYDNYDCAWSDIWSSDIPYSDTLNYDEGYRYLTNLIGTRLYLHRGLIDGPFYITAFEHGGSVAWHSKRFDNPMIGMMEDLNGDFYVRVISEGLYKVGPNGGVLWNVLRQPQMQKPSGLAPTDNSGRVGPICGDDGRIWVSTRTLASSPIEYHVFNADGSLYKSGNFGASINPIVCCYGHDGRFYMATDNLDIRCYNNWDEEVWTTALPGLKGIMNVTITIQDMVMDSNNMIYVIMKRSELDAAGNPNIEIFAINPNGEIVSDIEKYTPIRGGSEFELAIGNDKKLVCLSSAGHIGIASGFEIDPGAIKREIHLEAIDN